jgi:hypothetical protein
MHKDLCWRYYMRARLTLLLLLLLQATAVQDFDTCWCLRAVLHAWHG